MPLGVRAVLTVVLEQEQPLRCPVTTLPTMTRLCSAPRLQRPSKTVHATMNS